MNKTRLIPFDVEKAKKGAKVVTNDGKPVKILEYNKRVQNGDIVIVALVDQGSYDDIYHFTYDGTGFPYTLFIEEEKQEKTRRTYSGTDSIFIPKDDEGIKEELIDAINGLSDNDALPMPLSVKRKEAWLAWLEKQGEKNTADVTPKFKVGDKVVLKHDKSCVGVIKYINFWNILLKFNDSNTCWYSEEGLEPYEIAEDNNKAEKETKTRRMTNQELSDWLRNCPNEFREFKQFGYVASGISYYISEADIPVNDSILIRRNYGKWEEPLIEE